MEQENIPQIVSEVRFRYREKYTYIDYLKFTKNPEEKNMGS